ncbi:hypothetical protein HK098_004922 [Nowakowskiella sp. JEL0407]|nr:hypothetical protein HK098_004922 [Nowakowskiella sp. JEL0407]
MSNLKLTLALLFALPSSPTSKPPQPTNYKYKYEMQYVRDRNGTLLEIKGNYPHLNVTDVPKDLRGFKSHIKKYNDRHHVNSTAKHNEKLEKRQWDNCWVDSYWKGSPSCWLEYDYPCLDCDGADLTYTTQRCFGVEASVGWDMAKSLALSVTGTYQVCTSWSSSCSKGWPAFICLRSTIRYKRCAGWAASYNTCGGQYSEQWVDLRTPEDSVNWCDPRNDWMC